jgi:hypothetical protein
MPETVKYGISNLTEMGFLASCVSCCSGWEFGGWGLRVRFHTPGGGVAQVCVGKIHGDAKP